jgi:hypothetical protein
VHHHAAPHVDHPEPAARLRILLAEPSVEREPREGSILARLRQADDGLVAEEGEAAQEARAERDRLEAAARAVDEAELAGSGVQQPEPLAGEARRVRHREVAEDDLARGDVDQAAAFVAPLAPAGRDVGAADRGHVRRTALRHGEPVQVAAVLGREARDERRLPERREAVALGQRGEAGVGGVHEHDAAVRSHGDVVHVEGAGRVRAAGHVEAVEAVVERAGRQRVRELPELPARAHPEPLGRREQAHRPVEAPLEEREPAVGLHPDQEQAVRLVRGEGEAGAGLREP